MLEEQVDRRIQIASRILERLDSGEPLSTVLSQIRLLAELCDDSLATARTDLAIHGLTRIPEREKRVLDPAFVQAFRLHCEFCSMEDPRNITVEKVLEDIWKDEVPTRSWVNIQSVYQLETTNKPVEPLPGLSGQDYDLLLQLDVSHKEAKHLLTRLQSYFYEYTSNKLLEAWRERDRLALLGPDYHLVLSTLGTLDTEVGNELEAALDRLRSTNPANWSLCALGCRTVVIRLSELLWKVPGDVYSSKLLGKDLDLSGQKEKNRLSAYIDRNWQQAKEGEKGMLEEAHELVPKIWKTGSKGKTGKIKLSEARTLVVDTFRLVDLLDQTTSLVPLSRLDWIRQLD